MHMPGSSLASNRISFERHSRLERYLLRGYVYEVGQSEQGPFMVEKVALVTLLALSVVLSACGQSDSDKSPVTAQDVKTKTTEAMDAAADYAAQTRAEYMEKARKELDNLNVKIQQLQKEAQAAGSESKAVLGEQVKRLQEQQRALEQKFTRFQSQGGEAWDEMKSGFEQAMASLEQAYEKARDKFGDNSQ
jgi:hypothetical protein